MLSIVRYLCSQTVHQRDSKWFDEMCMDGALQKLRKSFKYPTRFVVWRRWYRWRSEGNMEKQKASRRWRNRSKGTDARFVLTTKRNRFLCLAWSELEVNFNIWTSINWSKITKTNCLLVQSSNEKSWKAADTSNVKTNTCPYWPSRGTSFFHCRKSLPDDLKNSIRKFFVFCDFCRCIDTTICKNTLI